MATGGFISPKALASFQDETGLADFTWRVYYHRRPRGRVLPIPNLMAKVQGYVILMHGWAGSHAIWEDLPAQVCQANRRLVCFALGLAAETPPPRDYCNTYVMLGHKDRLVALGPTLDLLEDMGLTSQNIQVMLGDHYFFTISQQSRRLHAFNRAELLRHILRLHNERLQQA